MKKITSRCYWFYWPKDHHHHVTHSSMVHQVQAHLSYLQGDIHWYCTLPLFKPIYAGTPPYLSHLLIPYCPSYVLRSSSSSNLLQVPTITLFSVPALSIHLL